MRYLVPVPHLGVTLVNHKYLPLLSSAFRGFFQCRMQLHGALMDTASTETETCKERLTRIRSGILSYRIQRPTTLLWEIGVLKVKIDRRSW